MDRQTLVAYDGAAAAFAEDWHSQPPPVDLHEAVRTYFRPGPTADIGCGSGREVAWLSANGFPCTGYDASEGLLREARRRYPALNFAVAALPDLPNIPDGSFENVMCETVIMHLPRAEIAPAVRRLAAVLRSGGTLYLTWRITPDGDQRDGHGRLYASFDGQVVRDALAGTDILLDEAVVSASSGKAIHRIVARRK